MDGRGPGNENSMRNFSATFVIAFAVLSAPLLTYAHASPIDYVPKSSEQLVEAPKEVRIRFSERVEKGASRILVADESGASITEGDAVVDAADAHFLSIPVRPTEDGTYFVTLQGTPFF